MCCLTVAVFFSGMLIAPAATLATRALQAHRGLCPAKRVTIMDKLAVVHCGPATAAAKAGGTTFHFKSGSCSNLSTGFALVLGTYLLGSTTNAGRPLFSISFNEAATKASVFWITQRAKYGILIANASLNGGHTGGRFSGRATVLTVSGKLSKVTASGSFHC
jgi:hypothetical protein